MLSTQTLFRQTSDLAVGAPAGARTRVSGSWSALGGYRPEIGSRTAAGTAVAPFAGVQLFNKPFANDNYKIRPLSPKRRRTG
jgi:hypothetical protein